ncbi:MAG: hypothetical protein SFZ24_07345 [Planctomycetota bacterium]|nr:hypothetical protein [Planctomycetota bacterium]
MLFSARKSGAGPIAVDFGVAQLKVLQLSSPADGSKPQVIAAFARPTPPELANSPSQRLDHQSQQLTEILKSGSFKGRRAVCSVSSAYTFVQHVQVVRGDARSLEPAVAGEVRTLTGREPTQFIVRHAEVCDVARGGAKKTEVICFAMPREAVLAHLHALRRCKLDAVGVHCEHLAMVRGVERFAKTGEAPTLIVDLGYATTKIAVTHGTALRLAKTLPVGGRDLLRKESGAGDEGASASASERRGLRAQLQAIESAMSDTGTALAVAAPPVAAASIDPAALEALADEIAQCVRYHGALFPDKKLERALFVGGEAARLDVCKRLARAAGAPAQVADPLAALGREAGARTDGIAPGKPSPGWAVALGLGFLPVES